MIFRWAPSRPTADKGTVWGGCRRNIHRCIWVSSFKHVNTVSLRLPDGEVTLCGRLGPSSLSLGRRLNLCACGGSSYDTDPTWRLHRRALAERPIQSICWSERGGAGAGQRHWARTPHLGLQAHSRHPSSSTKRLYCSPAGSGSCLKKLLSFHQFSLVWRQVGVTLRL